MKYFRTYLLSLEAEFASWANIAGWFLVASIPSLVLVLVWLAILGGRQSLGGLTKSDFLVYYIFITFGWYIVGGSFGLTVGRRIKDGSINNSLLKPYNFVIEQAIREQAWKTLSFIISFPALAAVLFFLRDVIVVSFTYDQIAFLAVSLLLGAFNFALVEAIIGLSALWIVEMWPIEHVKEILLSLFGGFYVPLSLMPEKVLFLANILPFKYMFYIPVSILLNKSTSPVVDIGLQAMYIGILFGVYKLMWHFGIKKYEAIGV